MVTWYVAATLSHLYFHHFININNKSIWRQWSKVEQGGARCLWCLWCIISLVWFMWWGSPAGFPIGSDGVSFPPTQVSVVPSPGHTGQHVSVQVTGTSAGTVLVAGDLFECCSDEDSWRDLSMDTAVQEVSRQEALRTADVIIPGHGLPFRVLRNSWKKYIYISVFEHCVLLDEKTITKKQEKETQIQTTRTREM